MEKKKLSFGVKLGYGMPGWPALFTITLVTTYGLFFLTDIVGMDSRMAGGLLTIGALWSIIIDPVVGMISDKRDPKKGRRRPFLLFSALPFGMVTCLLFVKCMLPSVRLFWEDAPCISRE